MGAPRPCRIYEQMRAGRLRSVTQGRTRLIPATAINDYVELLMRESEVHHDTVVAGVTVVSTGTRAVSAGLRPSLSDKPQQGSGL
jgi:hypothetical protein